MTDTATQRPIRVSTEDPSLPYIMVSVELLDKVRKLLVENGIPHWVEVVVPTTDEATIEVGDVEEGMDGEAVVELAVGELAKGGGKTKKKGRKKKVGRTTSVSIMTSAAVKKMGKGWIVLPSDTELLKALGKPRIFDLGLADVEGMTSSLPTDMRAVLQELDDERKREQQVVVAKVAVMPPRKK